MSHSSKVHPAQSAQLRKQQSKGVKKLQKHWYSNPKTANTNQRKGIQLDDRNFQIVLNPHERKWGNMTTPSITTLTIFEETEENSLKLVQIYDQVSELTKKNKWLTGRLKMMPEGISLYYGNDFVDCFQSFTRKHRVDLNCTYQSLVELSRPYAVKQGRDCVDQDQPLFKVTCLVSGEVKKQLVLVFSLSSVIADVYTFYRLYAMLDKRSEKISLQCARDLKYLDALKGCIGASNYKYTESSPALQYHRRTFLSKFFWKRQKTVVHYIDEDIWLKDAKKRGQNNQVEVSTNDCLTSWFFKLCECNFGIMMVNFRNRLLEIDNSYAGNYTSPILYREEDYQTPFLIRLSLGDKNVRRAAKVQLGDTKTAIGTSLPNVIQTHKNNSALSSNWYSVSRYIIVEGCKQTLHIPIIDHKEQPYKNMMIIFQSTASTMGAIIVGRGLVMDEENFPLGHGILKKSCMKFEDIFKPTAKISTLQDT